MNDKEYVDLQKKLVEKLIPIDIFSKEVREDILEYVTFRHELSKESNRGCALLAASHLDFSLEKSLRTKFIGSSKELKAMFDFNGPLGTFSGRIQISYAIGLISKYHTNDLQLIRKIRNVFGHSPTILDFENSEIQVLCSKLKLVSRSNTNSRSRFITSVSFISGVLLAMEFKEVKFKEFPEVNLEKLKDTDESFRKNFSELLKIYDDIEKI